MWTAAQRHWALALAILATLGALQLLILGAPPPLTELPFGYGPKIALIAAGEPLGDATRLPAVPYFLGALAALGCGSTLAFLLKNLILLTPLAWVLLRVWQDGPRDWLSATGLLLLLSFPQLSRHAFSLVPEEGYLIALIALVFFGILRATPATSSRQLAPYALAIALLPLIKSTMLAAAPVLAIALALKCRSRAAAALILVPLVMAILALSTLHWNNSGRFTPTSSLNGYDFWKANNAYALAVFPERTLDEISALAPRVDPGLDEWQWNDAMFAAGLGFWREQPRAALDLLARRVGQVLVRVRGETSPSSFGLRDQLKPIGIGYMVIWRIALWAALALALACVWRWHRRRGSVRRGELTDALAFLALIAALALPWLIGWGSERRLMPMVIPVALYLLHLHAARSARSRHSESHKRGADRPDAPAH